MTTSEIDKLWEIYKSTDIHTQIKIGELFPTEFQIFIKYWDGNSLVFEARERGLFDYTKLKTNIGNFTKFNSGQYNAHYNKSKNILINRNGVIYDNGIWNEPLI